MEEKVRNAAQESRKKKRKRSHVRDSGDEDAIEDGGDEDED